MKDTRHERLRNFIADHTARRKERHSRSPARAAEWASVGLDEWLRSEEHEFGRVGVFLSIVDNCVPKAVRGEPVADDALYVILRGWISCLVGWDAGKQCEVPGGYDLLLEYALSTMAEHGASI